MKRYYILLLILFLVLLTGCEVYFVTNQQDQSTYDQPIAEPIMYPVYDPAPAPQPPYYHPIYVPQAGTTIPVASPAKPAPQPARPGSDLHGNNNRSGASETTTPNTGRPTVPTNTNNTQQSTQPARTEGGRR